MVFMWFWLILVFLDLFSILKGYIGFSKGLFYFSFVIDQVFIFIVQVLDICNIVFIWNYNVIFLEEDRILVQN